MCPFYNAYLFEITGTTKGVFTHSQSSCHIAKVVLAFRQDSRQIPIAPDAPPRHTSRGFLHWRFAYAGPGARRSTFMGPASANLHKLRHACGREPRGSQFGRWLIAPSQDLDGRNSSAT